MTEPTKGPWRWEKSDDPYYGYILRGAEDWPVLGIPPVYPAIAPDGPVGTGDGRLIEKAPEMLALLRGINYGRPPEELARIDELVDYILLGELTREGER